MATKKRALETQSGFGEILPLDSSQWEVSSFVKQDTPKQEKKDEPSNLKRGFQKALYQIPQTIGGTLGLAGDLVGSDGLRDYGMGIYDANTKKVEGLTRESDSLSSVMDGNGNLGDWLASGAGYVGGQALTAVATGGLGGLVGRQIASRAIKGAIASEAEKLAAKEMLLHGAKVGAGTAAFGSNLVQEAGSIYPDAIEQAKKDGVELTGMDKARIVASALGAASIETLTDGIMVNKALGGGRRAIKDAAGNQVNESIGKAALREVPHGMAREGITEGLQTGIERFGANQDLTSQDAIRDYVDSASLGALGGGLGGAGGSIGKQKIVENGALSRAANAGIDAENATLLTSPQNDGSQPSANLPATQNNSTQQFTGMDELISAVQNEDNPSLVREIVQRQVRQQMEQSSEIEDGPANFNELLQQSNQRREQDRIETRGSWEDAKEQSARELAEQDRIEQENRLRLPAPNMPIPGGVLIDDNGTLRPQTYQDAAASQVAAAQREELGQSVPYGGRGGIENVQVPSNDNINSTDLNELPTLILNGQGTPFATKIAADVRRNQLGKNFSIIPVDGGFAVQNNVPGAKNAVPPAPPSTTINEVADPVAEQAEQSYILHQSGKPFTNKIGAQKRLKQLGGNHTVVPVEGGFAIRNNDPIANADGAIKEATAPATQQELQSEVNTIQPGDIMHPSGKPFTVKYPAIMAQRQSGGELIQVDGGYIVRPPAKQSLEEVVGEEVAKPKFKKGKTGAETMRNKLAAENPFLSFVATHGINIDDRSDVGGERGKARLIAGHGPLFRKNGLKLDELAQMAHERGFLTDAQMESDRDNGGVKVLSEMIERSLKNEVVGKDQSEATNPDHELLNEAYSLGIDVKGKTADEVYDLVKVQHDQLHEANLDEEWNRAVELLQDLSDEAKISSKENNLLELRFAIEELENAEENDTGSESETSSIATGRASEVETGSGRTTETATEQAQASDGSGGDQGFRLTGETEQEARERIAQEEREAQARTDDEARLAAAERDSTVQREVADRQDVSADNFSLTSQVNDKAQQKQADAKTVKDQLAGQTDIFSINPNEAAKEQIHESDLTPDEKLANIAAVNRGDVSPDDVWKKNGDDLTESDAVINTNILTIEDHQNVMKLARTGKIKVEDIKSAYFNFKENEEKIKLSLSAKKKDDLLKSGGYNFAANHKSDNKDKIIRSLFSGMMDDFAYFASDSISYGFGKGERRNAIDASVAGLTQEALDKYAEKQKKKDEEAKAWMDERLEKMKSQEAGAKNPVTLADFQTNLRGKMAEGKTFAEARMMLTQEQRSQFDTLAAESTRAERAKNKFAAQEQTMRAPGEALTAGETIKTKHTKHGHDLWQFNLDQRVSPEEYKALSNQSRKLGGDYSSYRGNGAIPGWQFRTPEAAQAFKDLIAGDNSAAKDVMAARRDAFADDRSQSASERLNEMAEALEADSEDQLNRDRKTNTTRRAGMASRAEANARAGIAFANTMRNIANFIDDGKAKFLDKVREKKQVSLLTSAVEVAQYDQQKAQGLSYAEIEKQKGMPANQETADFAAFPSYTAYRSDLANLARQLLEVEGTKIFGKKLLDLADDTSDVYLAFAKANLNKVMTFTKKDGGIAAFTSKVATENAITRSGYRGQAIAFMVKRGEYVIIQSPSAAIKNGVWSGDGDKRITLSRDFGTELVEKIGRAARRGSKVSVPWQFESTYDKFKTLSRMNIETASEYRAALREFISLREQPKEANKVKELERSMIGRQNDGMDFFPTPIATADEMVQVAEIQPGMKVLEPSAGWGHIAERIREAGVEPDVVELSGKRRELLEAKGFNLVGSDFLEVSKGEGYDRILMNPPFSDRRDAEHVQHAYSLLKPGGRLVAIMGEGVFFGRDKSAEDFRNWVESVGGTDEKLAEGTFLDPSLPVNTAVNARMVVINKGTDQASPLYSRDFAQRSKFGFDVDELQPIVDQISSTWKNAPKINIVQTIDDLPFDAPSDARGAYFKKQVYLVAANLRDQAQAESVLLHETLGHAGLNELFGEKLASALRSIAMKNRKIAEAAAVWRKGNTDIKGKMSDERYHLVSIEEALADYVGTGRIINGVEKLLAAIQKGLRAIGLNSVADWMENATDAEVLSMLASARKHIEKGSEFSVFGEQQAQAFSRDEKNALSTDAEAKGGNRDALFSRSVITGDNNRARTPEQLRAFENVGRTVEVPTLKERFNKLTENLGKKLAQGIVDQFAPIKDLSAEAYGLMRLSKGASGAFESMLKGGQLKLTDGVYDFDEAKRGGVVDRLLVPLQGESDDFMWWVAGNRAEALSVQGKEHLFTADDIKAFKSLSDGQSSFDYTIQHGLQKGKTTRDRAIIYADSLKTFNEFNKNTLDMAEQSGLIDPESRKIWESEFYIPFYRVSEESDDGVRGMNVKSGVVRQQAFKKLKGGTDKLNSDLLENTLMNWAHLLDASAKNRAAKSTLEAAENIGAALPAMSGDKKTVWYMDGGEKKYFSVEDPHLLTAIQGLEYAGMRSPIMNAMSTMKHAMTMGVTASPFFKVRNLIRDSVSAIGIAGLDYNPGKNIKEGWKLTNPKSDDYFRLLAGGGTIHFGAMLEGSEAKRIRKLVASGVDESTILNSDNAMKSFYRKHVAPAVDAYNELGNRGESINRASLYDQLIKQGKNHAEASLMARDLMDFSMQGAWTSIRFLTQVVPFMNARLQGLYKLGKSAKEDPKRFGTVLGAVAMSSIALMLAYSDDEDWKKREDFDRDNFWWFKFGDTAFRIPKPFEIGAIGTLAERGVEYFTQDEMTGERFMSRFKHLMLDSLSMNPIPQMIKPVIDIYANNDSFTGRPIETMSMERLQSDYRFNGSTSMVARASSTVGNAVSNNHFLSPVQIDHLIRGYFGWLGSFAVGSADRIARPFTGEPEKATPDYAKWLSGGMVADTKTASSRYVSQMYEQAKALDEAYGTWRMLLKTGKVEESKEFSEENADKLRRYKGLQNVKKQVTSLNEQVRVIERSNLDADEKREKINLIQQRKDNIARRASL